MKITSTDRYLSLVLSALENTLIPELTSSDAKATAAIMKSVLAELQKREHYTPRLLAEHMAEGRVIAESMAAFLAELSGSATLAASTPLPANASFQALAEAHGVLTQHLVALADELATRRASTRDEAQGQYLSALLRKAADWEREYYVAQRNTAAPASQPPPSLQRGGPLTRELLESFLRTRHPDGDRCSVISFEPLSGGFSKQTFRITLRDGSGKEHALIVRKDIPAPMLAYGGYFVAQEYHLLRDVHASGLPVAEPLYLGVEVPGVDADFYVMTTLAGKVPGSFLGGATEAIPESVLLHMAELLARLHSLKPDTFATYLSLHGDVDPRRDTVESCYRHQIAEWKAYYAREQHLPSPFIGCLFDWLERNIPRNSTPSVLVHGDFNIHNALAEDGRVTGILDWECANFGAAEQDLAYIKPHVSRYIGWDKFMAHYRACGGAEIDEATMNFCLAFSCMRMSLSCSKGQLNVQQGNVQDLRLVMIELGFALEFMNMGLASVTC